MRRLLPWLLVIALTLLAAYQRVGLQRAGAEERRCAEKTASLFPYTLRRADFRALPDVMAALAREENLEEKIRLFKRAQELAVAFTDDLLMLNDLRFNGPPIPTAGLQYGSYVYRPATPEQEALQWKILKGNLFATLWTMERHFYANEGQMRPADRDALNAMIRQVRAIGERMILWREQTGQPHPDASRAAASGMDRINPMLDELHQITSSYQASLPPLQMKPGGLYDRLYGR